MKEIRSYLDTLRERNDAKCAQCVEGWPRIKFFAVKGSRPFWQRVKAVRRIMELIPQYGWAVRRKTGVGIARQVWQQYLGAVKYGMPPDEYYQYAIYNDFKRLGQYIAKMQWAKLLRALFAKQDAGDKEVVDDKRVSNYHFRERGLPIIPILAEFEQGEVTSREWSGASRLPPVDLFSKPADADRGRGARRWKVRHEHLYEAEDGSLVSQDKLVEKLRQQSKKQPVILQRRVANHAELQTLTGDTLVSLRIITMRPPRSKAQYLIGRISLPVGDEIGTNGGFNVLRAPIEASTGRLGAAYDQNDFARVMEPISVHPATGERIAGFQLPDWDEAVDLALRAHKTLPTIALVGWDIAITPDGAVIIEGNSMPGADSPQVAHKSPLGGTQFPELYMANLKAASSDAQPAL